MKYPYERKNLEEIAKKRIKKFTKVIYKIAKSKKFDLIIATGDSGVGMAKITSLIYKQLNLPLPKIIKIPIYRYNEKNTSQGKKFDNSILLPEVKKQIKNPEEIQNILFVDDEINTGNSLYQSLNIIKESTNFKKTKTFVVAEDHGFKSKNKKITFLPYAKEIKGLNNIVSYCIPDNIKNQITYIFSDEELSPKERFNILLNEPVKALKNKKPYFTNKYDDILNKRIKSFDKIKNNFESFIKNIIKEAIAEFKDAAQ